MCPELVRHAARVRSGVMISLLALTLLPESQRGLSAVLKTIKQPDRRPETVMPICQVTRRRQDRCNRTVL